MTINARLFGFDAGRNEQTPLRNLTSADTYANASAEVIVLEPALTAYTAGGAWIEDQWASKGRITPGLAADVAVLSHGVLPASIKRLPDPTSVLALIDGKAAFDDGTLKAAERHLGDAFRCG